MFEMLYLIWGIATIVTIMVVVAGLTFGSAMNARWRGQMDEARCLIIVGMLATPATGYGLFIALQELGELLF
jgi:hypothetical protein